MSGIGIMFSVGKYGGFYYAGGWSKRLCLGWAAITFFPTDGDNIIELATRAFSETTPLADIIARVEQVTGHRLAPVEGELEY